MCGGAQWPGGIAPVAPFAPPEDELTDFERYYLESKPIGRLSVQKT